MHSATNFARIFKRVTGRAALRLIYANDRGANSVNIPVHRTRPGRVIQVFGNRNVQDWVIESSA